MATFAVWHPDVEDFIKSKREDGRFRQFNLSLLIDDDFINAVKNDTDWPLIFPLSQKEVDLGLTGETVLKDLFWEEEYCKSQNYILQDGKIVCRVYKTVKAVDLWNTIMKSTYDFAEPGFLLIDNINKYNNNYFCEKIRATNPCGEQPLPPYGSCLLGSVNLAKLVIDPFTDKATFDWPTYQEVVKVFTRMLDNVVEMNGLPLEEQRASIEHKRRHGMGFLGLGSALSLLGVEYGSPESIAFTEEVMKVMAVTGFEVGVDLAKEKGMAPVFTEQFIVNGESKSGLEWWVDGAYMARIWEVNPALKQKALKYGCRFTHHTSIAPTGTISLSLNNNASNGIEPSFSHMYTRNVIKEGKKSKQAVNVYSYEMLLYKELTGKDEVPSSFSTTDSVTPKQHVDIQAAAQIWCDSSISKTINVPTDLSFDKFKDTYMYAYDMGLKGCTTFRFNPEAFQGVLVKESDLEATEYEFTLKDGTVHVVKGNTDIQYEGEVHSAANLYDALKEGYYGKF